MPALLEQYRVSDFLEWHEKKQLILNPDFQRGSVWVPAAKTFLIDTILRQLPIPKIFLRTRIDIRTRRSIREVVDGQQRLRAILDFAHDKFVLTKRAGDEFRGLQFSDLAEEHQQHFLEYAIAVDQLINADDEEVLEVFARLNSYSVSLNPPEKRHALFQGDFKWAVRETSKRLAYFWDRYRVFSVRERVRLLDDSLTAEMFGVLLNGVTDGGQPKITALYRQHDGNFQADAITRRVESTFRVLDELAPRLDGSALLRPPHLLMLFAAVAHRTHGLPAGQLGNDLPRRDGTAALDIGRAADALLELAAVIDMDEPPARLEAFWRAAAASTQRISSRRVRFSELYRALA